MRIEDLELLERTVMSQVFQALTDYKEQASLIFEKETDLPQDIAEDVTRGAIDAMGVSATGERLYGKVDIKKAIYAFLPAPIPVALMLDVKAEKHNGDRTATIQMSQTSMRVKMRRAGKVMEEQGKLGHTVQGVSHTYQVVTIIAKLVYEETESVHVLRQILVACIPNGQLQNKYNRGLTPSL